MEPDCSTVLDGFLRMTRRCLRVLIIASHPVQYASPIFRLLAKDPRVEIQVAYCSMRGAESHIDPDFGVEVKWDVPLLDGYSWIAMPNRSPFRLGLSFFSLVNPQVWRLIRSRKFDAVVLHTGYRPATFWIAVLAAKLTRVAFLFSTDAHGLSPRDRREWKRWIKKLIWPHLFRLADQVIVPSTAGVSFMASLGIPENRVALTPYCVNNEWWTEQLKQVNRADLRTRWGVPQDAFVVLFSAKLQPWKRPSDLLRAFAGLPACNAYLVFAGEGSLRSALESEAESLGIAKNVRFLGFVNQSGLPEVYAASDILVLPSEYEPFGVVVNEAMLCGCCVVVSDHVGARFDLVREGETGFVFRAGDVDALAAILQGILRAPDRLRKMRDAARERMTSWAPDQNVEMTVEALNRAVASVRRRSGKEQA
jgi:glycosyltransferase involved in cell wall biosynthesis